MKHCPLCNNDLEIEEFGICRARKDCRNLYCKSCIREKVNAYRKDIRSYTEKRRRRVEQRLLDPHPLFKPITLSPVERVREAIKNGCLTQQQIVTATRSTKDEVSDAIAHLLLWAGEIKTRVVENERHYFINEPVEKEVVEKSVQRKPDLPCSFSSMKGLMPGKKVETKIGGWVAA